MLSGETEKSDGLLPPIVAPSFVTKQWQGLEIKEDKVSNTEEFETAKPVQLKQKKTVLFSQDIQQT